MQDDQIVLGKIEFEYLTKIDECLIFSSLLFFLLFCQSFGWKFCECILGLSVWTFESG